jgi:Coenzyme PQQ synthesis protein D (PqqD)
MSKTAVKPISRKSDLVTQEHEKEILIYDLLTDKAFSLNESSSLIWSLCNGKNSVSEITAELSRKLNSSVGEDFVWLALEQLKKDDLLANGEEISIDFGNLSRRDVIRKVGFATLAALPVITAVSAPSAVRAASTTCSTAAPGGSQCRCACNVAQGSTCGSGLVADPCNAGCTCTRTAASCYGGADPNLINTALGACS